MANAAVAKHYIVDSTGRQVGVILPIEEYHALLRLQPTPTRKPHQRAMPALEPLYGVLCHLGGTVSPTDEIDEVRRELWAGWDRDIPS